MGTVPKDSKCRTRTHWSLEMDQYFINLMLEEISKGNRVDDHLFTKRAWRHMTTMFNAKFDSKYEKDVLKNRHKTLRKLYRLLNNMLEQKGFTWDESQHMVSADDEVWDKYIKAHPEVKSYRIKMIPYYSDLCEIYNASGLGCKDKTSMQNSDGDVLESGVGELLEEEECTSLDTEELNCILYDDSSNSGVDTAGTEFACGMAAESLHDIMIDEDYRISETKGQTDEFLSDSVSPTRTYWQPPMDRYFIDLMLDQVNKGNQVNGVFSKQAWKEMLSAFNARFGFEYEMGILKNRYKTLRRQHHVIKNLLEMDGFGWDRARQMVVADDRVWGDYIKVHTEARQYMKKPVPCYEDLCLICRELNCDERESTSSHHNFGILVEVPETNLDIVNQSPAPSGSGYDQSYVENESSHSNFHADSGQIIKRQLEIAPAAGPPKKSRNEDESMVHDIHEMVTTVSSLMDKGKGNEILNAVPVEHVVAAIQALPDMDEDLLLDACGFLEDEKRAKTFLALDVKLRKKWLIRKLRRSQ